jgi:putative endonuclease
MHYVYILYSRKLDRFYVGESDDPARRLQHHRDGHQRYTRRATDWVLVCCLPTSSRRDALGIEQKIKQSKNRKSIIRWIHSPGNQVAAADWQPFAW